MSGFKLYPGLEIVSEEFSGEPVRRALKRFHRDLNMAAAQEETPQAGQAGHIRPACQIYLRRQPLPPEHYRILVESPHSMTIESSDDLGVIYAFCWLSQQYLGILPFWFWNDQEITKKAEIRIPEGVYEPSPRPVQYRGWFINDEVLISSWDAGVSSEYPWEMAFEALLRCGGNLVIPGTDKNARRYGRLAADMGLWITQHHAEPLGAEMFARAYPDLTPSYSQYPQLFEGLWEEAVLRHKDEKVIWNIGFRGQGDVPFWEQDAAFDTPAKRGELISHILEKQCALVRRHVESPVFCTNLYGEAMELYREGLLRLPEDVIMIWADNGYGKMVSRRQGNHNPRVPSLPDTEHASRRHGTYYHVSFYDLQAANHITMLPNSMEFVERELGTAYIRGIRSLWLINCSNIKPHVYPLDFVAGLWNGTSGTAKEHRKGYLTAYYPACAGDELQAEEMAECIQDYHRAMVPFGPREDERAGEQFYNYVTRELACCWVGDGGHAPCGNLFWCVREKNLSGQVQWYRALLEDKEKDFDQLFSRCNALADALNRPSGTERLWRDSLLLQVQIHRDCLKGAIRFGQAFSAYEEGAHMKAFYLLGQSVDWYQRAVEAMDDCSHGKWAGFYRNECLTDVKETAYLLRRVMSYVRILGDGPYFYNWQREVIYPPKDRRVVLITNLENHMTDEALYAAMKEHSGFGE